MSAWLMRPLPMAISSPLVVPTAANLADPDPRLVLEVGSTAPWAIPIDADLGGDWPVDTIAILYHSGPAGGLWRVHAQTAAQGPFGVYGSEPIESRLWEWAEWRSVPTFQASRFHGLRELPEPISCRYLRVEIYWPLAQQIAPYPFRAGVLAIGRRLQPGGAAGGFDWGAGRRVLDLSEVRVLPGGGRGRWQRARVPEVRGSFSQLTDAELAEFWDLQLAVGESGPVLLVEAPDTRGALGLHDRIHYGTLTSLDFYERRQADKNRVDIRLVHWL
ncbi:MAG: hypothetical protein ACK4Z0_08915 [Sphingomonadaceae bacterium]